MKTSKSKAGKTLLRRKTRKEPDRQTEHLRDLSSQEMKQMGAEPGAHEIELEMQNEELRRAQTELEQSRNRYAELYDYAPVGYFTLDARGMIREVNKTGADLLGVDRRLLPGKSFSAFLPNKEDLQTFRAHHKDVFLKQMRQVCEVRLAREKALPLYVQLQSTAAENIDGKAGMIRMAVMDITDRVLAEEASTENELRYRSLFNGMTQGFALHELLYDEKGEPADCRFLEVNPAFEQMTGLRRSDLIGRTKRQVFPGDDPSWIKKYATVAQTCMPAHFETWSLTLNKHYDVYAYCPAPHRIAALFLDITERVRAEQSLREREEALKQTNAELETVNKELESFSYAVANDLRKPLRSIEGFSRAILEDYAGLLDDTGKDFCRRIQEATLRMSQLIEALWTMSCLTSGELAENVVDLSSAAQIIAHELKKRQPKRQVDFITAKGVKVKGDMDMMRVALENLFDNAWKFTSRHPSATIEFGVMERDGTRSYFVRDDGAGFDMAFADRLFRPFQRLHSDSEFPGIGIGLAISATIIKRHGGRIWAEGAVEKGATIFFTL